MPSPELANGFSVAEREEIEPRVRAVHGVPLIDLLEGENKKCAIAQDPVSIYSTDRPNGTEYAVVFPPLSGQELNKHLGGISKVQAHILGVYADFSDITESMQGTRAKDHASGLGAFWEVFSRSLPIHTNVFLDSVLHEAKTEMQRQADKKLDEEMIQSKDKGIMPVRLAVPVVRFLESESGARGFIFNETGHELLQEIVDEIGERVNSSEKSSKPFEKNWLSGMVGIDMLVAAHPDIRGKKNDSGDNWGNIWEKARITMSEVMDQEIREREPTQISGPVQIGIIALHAFSRYPETFDPFIRLRRKPRL